MSKEVILQFENILLSIIALRYVGMIIAFLTFLYFFYRKNLFKKEFAEIFNKAKIGDLEALELLSAISNLSTEIDRGMCGQLLKDLRLGRVDYKKTLDLFKAMMKYRGGA